MSSIGGIVGAAIVGGVATVGAAAIGANAASKASKRAIAASDRAGDQAVELIDDSMEGVESALDPYAAYGQPALENISNLDTPDLQQFEFNAEDFKDDPSYQLRLSEAMQAYDRMAGKNRQLGSGNRIYGGIQTAGNEASKEYQNAWQRAFNTNLQNNAVLSERYGQSMQKNQYLAGVGLSAAGGQADYRYRAGADKASVRVGQGANAAAANMFSGQAQAQAWNTVGQTAGYLGGQYIQSLNNPGAVAPPPTASPYSTPGAAGSWTGPRR